ncbi:hypothetical protein [Rhodanobacter sp. DHB23]|uniref:hypothetical protein n=1 Tax=Rhodanobacter sp. DHB23 TaxID=2775923 RepID=UPI001783C77A|nr:hypothetical protein [Rhodanobacter sp. DHB23]MBD8874059.1 hypothetical protein [Rhodanobacter sp. DHB23]
MKILTVCVVAALAASAVGNAVAADSGNAVVWRDFTDTVAPAQQLAYEAGIKAYNQCLAEHHVKFSEPTVTHETGNDYMYSSDVGPITWADMDTLDAEAKACDATWRAQGNPHLKSETSAFMILQPDMSNLPAGWQTHAAPPILRVIDYTLKPGREAETAFSSSIKKIAAAAAKAKWPYYWMTAQIEGGGDGAPDYILVIRSKSWAEVGAEPNPALWKMVAGVYGQADADALRKSLDDSIAKGSDHFDKYNADLSYTAGK